MFLLEFHNLQQVCISALGAVGRNSKGDVIVINTEDVYDQAVFSNPSGILERPLAESTLYLENSYIQYIHALCLRGLVANMTK